jgi:hypothetical protein
MQNMNNKDSTLVIRLNADLLEGLRGLAQRLGDGNTSAATRLAIRVGLDALQEKSINEIIGAYAAEPEVSAIEA